MDSKVDEYIDKQISPQKEICSELREIILKTIPDIKEKMKWGVPTYLMEGKNHLVAKYYYVALKEKVNLGFAIKDLSIEQLDLLEGSGKEMRHISIHSSEDIDETKIIQLLEMIE